jgi:Domain of unknown function (DUF4145)
MTWTNLTTLPSAKFICGYCNNNVASAQGYLGQEQGTGFREYVYICPHCENPTLITHNRQIPGVAPGNSVQHLPIDIETLYEEARNAVSVNANTAAVLACRKLLMNIAVNHGAKEGATFVSYIEHLATKGFVPPNGREWVDHIRSKGNEATHEIRLMSNEEAKNLISFAEMLLKFVYEFPNKVPK